jgi:hypothetical protein
LRKVLSGLVAPKSEQEIREARQEVDSTGSTPIADCCGGVLTTVCGVLKTVSLRPRAGVPAVQADLFDGTGHLTIIFLGRRSIAGIEPGRRLLATGRVNGGDEAPVMYNPRYRLLPLPERG